MVCGVSEETSPLPIKVRINILPSHQFQQHLWSIEVSTVSGTCLKAPSTHKEYNYPEL